MAGPCAGHPRISYLFPNDLAVVPGALQHEVMLRRPGTSFVGTCNEVPHLRRTVARCAACGTTVWMDYENNPWMAGTSPAMTVEGRAA
jgi:hypothetical protein